MHLQFHNTQMQVSKHVHVFFQYVTNYLFIVGGLMPQDARTVAWYFLQKEETKHKEDMGSTQASLSALRSFSIKVLQHSLKVFHIALHIITTMSDHIAEWLI